MGRSELRPVLGLSALCGISGIAGYVFWARRPSLLDRDQVVPAFSCCDQLSSGRTPCSEV